MKRPDSFWCDLEPDDFAEELFARLGGQLSASQLGLQQLLMKAGATYYGALPWAVNGLGQNGPNSAFIQRTGEQGKDVSIKVNQARQNANAKHQIVTNPTLTWTATAVNTDSQSLADADRCTAILENLWKQKGFEADAISCALEAILFGESARLILWDATAGDPVAQIEEQRFYAGDVRSWSVPTWDLFRSASAKSFEESPWLCARVPRSKWELVAEFPDRRDDILNLSQSATSLSVVPSVSPVGPGALDPDSVAVFYFFHKRMPALPTGLQAILLSPDCILAHGPLEDCYADPLPIHRLAAGDVVGTPWAYSDYWDSLALQDLRDDVESALATNIVTFGRQLIAVESGVNVSTIQIANGPTLIEHPPGKMPPTPVQLTAQPPSAFQHLEALKRAGREVMGLNDFVMGQVESAEMNAQYAALMASLAIQQNSNFQKSWVKFTNGEGRGMLKVFRAKASHERKVAIIGEHGPQTSETFNGQTFEALDDVYVTIAGPLSQSTAGRMQIAQMFLDRGFVLTPEQLQQVVTTGNLKPLTQGLEAELVYIAAENEQLLKGTSPPVKITDSHQMHIREHRAATFSEQARENEQVNVVTDEHIKQHLDFWLNTDPRILAAMGQAPAPPPQMPAPGGPPDAKKQEQAAKPLENPLDSQPQFKDVKLPEAPPDPHSGMPFNGAS